MSRFGHNSYANSHCLKNVTKQNNINVYYIHQLSKNSTNDWSLGRVYRCILSDVKRIQQFRVTDVIHIPEIGALPREFFKEQIILFEILCSCCFFIKPVIYDSCQNFTNYCYLFIFQFWLTNSKLNNSQIFNSSKNQFFR